MLRILVLLCCAPVLAAQTADLEKVLKDSEIAWNRGDLAGFASYYDDSPETTFIGREVTHGGTQAILDNPGAAWIEQTFPFKVVSLSQQALK